MNDELRKNYIETGKVRFVSRDLPLGMHADAPKAAEAVRCAGDQSPVLYWRFRDVLISNSPKLSQEGVLAYARELQLDFPAFHECLETGKYRSAVEQEANEAASLSISGTPTFIVGETTKEGVDGVVVVGAQPFQVFDTKIQQLLSH